MVTNLANFIVQQRTNCEVLDMSWFVASDSAWIDEGGEGYGKTEVEQVRGS